MRGRQWCLRREIERIVRWVEGERRFVSSPIFTANLVHKWVVPSKKMNSGPFWVARDKSLVHQMDNIGNIN
jgi:hypothetical protein